MPIRLLPNKFSVAFGLLLLTLAGVFVPTRPHQHVVVSSPTRGTAGDDTALMTILEVGLPRSGSLAIYDYFQCQSQNTLHYCCDSTVQRFPCPEQRTIGQSIHANAIAEKSLFDGCHDDETTSTRVVTGMAVETSEPYGYFIPQHFALPVLYQDDPAAVWILPLRNDASTWATSVLHWHSETQRFLASFGLLSQSTRVAPANDQQVKRITKGLQAAVERAYDLKMHAQKRHHLQGIYNSHVQKVRAFAQAHAIRLIEINIDDSVEAERILQTEFPSISSRPNCWSFDPATLDDDWKNLTLPF